jgi:hypothetical protein
MLFVVFANGIPEYRAIVITMNNPYGVHRAICTAEYGIDSGEGLNFIHAVDIDFLKTADYR